MTPSELVDWLVATEKRFGGYTGVLKRRKISIHDPRTPDELRQGGREGGDRMSASYHGYAPKYAEYLADFVSDRDRKLTIIEVGVLRGTGLAIWSDLFPRARLIGL